MRPRHVGPDQITLHQVRNPQSSTVLGVDIDIGIGNIRLPAVGGDHISRSRLGAPDDIKCGAKNAVLEVSQRLSAGVVRADEVSLNLRQRRIEVGENSHAQVPGDDVPRLGRSATHHIGQDPRSDHRAVFNHHANAIRVNARRGRVAVGAGADEVALCERAFGIDVDGIRSHREARIRRQVRIVPPGDIESTNGYRVFKRVQAVPARRSRQAAVEADQDDCIVPIGQRVGARAGLSVAIDRDHGKDARQGKVIDRAHRVDRERTNGADVRVLVAVGVGKRNIEGDFGRCLARFVDEIDRIPQRTRDDVLRIILGIGHREGDCRLTESDARSGLPVAEHHQTLEWMLIEAHRQHRRRRTGNIEGRSQAHRFLTKAFDCGRARCPAGGCTIGQDMDLAAGAIEHQQIVAE